MMFNFIVFFGGVGIGSFATLLILWHMSQLVDDDIMTKEDFEQYRKEWEDVHEEESTSDELFFDLLEELDGS